MDTNYTQKILASANMTASDVEDAIHKRDIELMVNKQLGDEVPKLGFREKKPYKNSVTVIKSNEADVLMWRNMDGSQRNTNIAASAPIAGKSDYAESRGMVTSV
jgi:hypothetical protein